VFREEKLIAAILGENHQIFMFPAIIERVVAEAIKIEETKNCRLFCLGKLSVPVYTSPSNEAGGNNTYCGSSGGGGGKTTHLLCVVIKEAVSIYEVNSGMKPKYKKL